MWQQLRPVFNDVFHHRSASHYLQQEVIQDLQSLFETHCERAPTHKDGDRILLCLSWIPAVPETGAHLRQLTNYSKALLGVKTAPVKLKILLTHEFSTRHCMYNIQYSDTASIKIINNHFLERLGSDLSSQITITCLVPDGKTSYYNELSKEIVQFDPTAIFTMVRVLSIIYPS